MPRNRPYPIERPSRRDLGLAMLMEQPQQQIDPAAAVGMLSALYGLQEQMQTAPIRQQGLQQQNELAAAQIQQMMDQMGVMERQVGVAEGNLGVAKTQEQRLRDQMGIEDANLDATRTVAETQLANELRAAEMRMLETLPDGPQRDYLFNKLNPDYGAQQEQQKMQRVLADVATSGTLEPTMRATLTPAQQAEVDAYISTLPAPAVAAPQATTAVPRVGGEAISNFISDQGPAVYGDMPNWQRAWENQVRGGLNTYGVDLLNLPNRGVNALGRMFGAEDDLVGLIPYLSRIPYKTQQ